MLVRKTFTADVEQMQQAVETSCDRPLAVFSCLVYTANYYKSFCERRSTELMG